MLCTCANVPMSCMSSYGSQFTVLADGSVEFVFGTTGVRPLFFRRKNVPTYACPLAFISSISLINLSSVTRTGIMTPGINGRRVKGTTNTCG